MITAAASVMSHPFVAGTLVILFGWWAAGRVVGHVDGTFGGNKKSLADQRLEAFTIDWRSDLADEENHKRLRQKGWRLDENEGQWWRPGGYDRYADGSAGYRYHNAKQRRTSSEYGYKAKRPYSPVRGGYYDGYERTKFKRDDSW